MSMKQLNVRLDDDDYRRLEQAKGDRTWREVLLEEVADE